MKLVNRSKILFIGLLILNYLVRTPGLMDEYYSGRFAFISLLTAFSLLFVFPKAKNVKLVILDICLFVFYLLNVFSILQSQLPSAGYLLTQSILLLFTTYLFFRFFVSKIPTEFILNTFIALSILVLLICTNDLIQVANSEGFAGRSIYKVIGFSGHKNLLSSYLFLLFGFLLYFLNSLSIPKAKRYLIIGIMTWQIICVVLVRSRTIYISFVLLALIYGFYYLKNRNILQFKYVKQFGLALVIGVALLAFGMSNNADLSRDIKELIPSNYLESGSAKQRIFVWGKTGRLIKEDPIFGFGAGNFKLVLPKKLYEETFSIYTEGIAFTRAHNDFLEIWVELGIFGLLVYLSLFGISIYALLITIRNSKPEDKAKLFILLGMIASFFIISFLDFPKERIEHQILFAFLLYLIVENCKTFFEQKNWAWKIPVEKRKFMTYGLLILLIPNFVISYFHISGEYHYTKAIEAKNRGDWGTAEKETLLAYSPFYQIDQNSDPVKLMEASVYYANQDYVKAKAVFEQAMEHSPYNHSVRNDYGSCLVQLKEYEKAVESYNQALTLYPRFEDAFFNLSFAYMQLGKFQEARNILAKVVEDTGKRDAFLAEIAKLEKG